MLSGREILILNMITEMFILNGEPIGSRTLEKNSEIGLSSATIRNVMSDLENLGYLVKMHSSSGRMPSRQGLLFYSNEVLNNFKSKINCLGDLKLESYRIENILRQASKFLSKISNYATLTFIPKEENSKILDLFLKKVSDQRSIFVITTEERVYSSVVEGLNFDISEIEKINNFLAKNFREKTIKHFKTNLKSKFLENFYNKKLMTDKLLEVIDTDGGDELHLDGLNKLLDHPDFKDLEDVKEIASLMDDDSVLIEKLKKTKDGFHILIGSEDQKNLNNLTIVTSTYPIESDKKAVIGILAPIRINYERAINSLIQVDDLMKKLLEDIGGFSG